ncbi:Concanavalin A-like lectin/glucanase domain superfamily [Arabidopsis suecica]|uniref:Concanavalin A-like lectin/glucanase domain superfamily n=1 Tax=Arabidopsis suecica TaxID=45249 RepID=A0A8T1ZYB0_ARASU|nr:Concanavalin A-like lectin/glucanase domain superfamily [Arabidopsis suecica]
MIELPLDSTCWRKFHRPLVQKTISFRIVRLSVSSEMAQELHLIWMIFCVHLICISSQEETGFIYKGFGETDHGVAKGLLQLTDGSRLKMGHTFFKNPFEFSSTRLLSFSTQLVCALLSKAGFVCGHGTAFLVPELVLPTIIMYLALVAVIVYLEKNYAKPREEWEKEDNGPRRFTYKSLSMATKGFNKDGLVRKRGFGEVNRGTPIETRRERRRKERKNRN